jgi:rare lipoprotein A (peptidoglycan hydrolase)
MRPLAIVAFATVAAWATLHCSPAAAQTFDDRWSIIPKAKAAEPPSPPTNEQLTPSEQHQNRSSPEDAQNEMIKQTFSGKAAFYSYRSGKTASGTMFDRDMLTAAHRTLPFGTRVRVTDVATNKSVTVIITDRGPKTPGYVLDLSLGAARALGITDRGIARVRADVL